MERHGPTVSVSPVHVLIDKEVRILVGGLKANQNITIRSWVNGDKTDIFESYVYYTSDNNGIVDLRRQSATGGLYTGVQPMGLFTSMIPSPNNDRAHSRMSPKVDVEKSLEFHIDVYDLHLVPELINRCVPLSSTTVYRSYIAPGVKRQPVRNGRLRGTIFIPPGKGPFPAVIDLFGTAGGLMEFRASLLASHGYLSFALAYFAHDDLPLSAVDLDLEYFEEAKDYLKEHHSAAKGDIGVIGVSVGGTIAMTLASYVEGFKCAVVINGPSFVQYATFTYKGRSWPGVDNDMNRMYVENNGVVFGSCLDSVDENNLGDAEIEFHKSKSSFLFFYSEADKAINTELMQRVLHHLLSKEKTCECKIITHPGAGHLLEPPYSPHAPLTHAKLINLPQRWGGNSKQHAEAQLSSWKEILKYLNEVFYSRAKL
ncbi:acyl-coenzyme A amino acid N-acyltransferase 2-like [Styela clava]